MEGSLADSVSGLMFVIGAAAAAAVFIIVIFVANRLVAPRNPSAAKLTAFECGFDPAGEPWSVGRLRFSVIAMLFVLFDAEALLLFAVASKLRGSASAVLTVLGFVVFLAVGLAFAWREGALEWRS